MQILNLKERYGVNPGRAGVLLLIATFLLLGNCPLRQSFQNLLKRTHHVSSHSSEQKKQFKPVGCQGLQAKENLILEIRELKSGSLIPYIGSFLLTSFFFNPVYPDLDGKTRADALFRNVHVYHVPIYLGNRALLI
ncbi:hypothetical protein N824_12475 [Pedobacter sp. V48]|nr:hypothetical protein N824_12475 [Pedobacter sp. V48]